MGESVSLSEIRNTRAVLNSLDAWANDVVDMLDEDEKGELFAFISRFLWRVRPFPDLSRREIRPAQKIKVNSGELVLPDTCLVELSEPQIVTPTRKLRTFEVPQKRAGRIPLTADNFPWFPRRTH